MPVSASRMEIAMRTKSFFTLNLSKVRETNDGSPLQEHPDKIRRPIVHCCRIDLNEQLRKTRLQDEEIAAQLQRFSSRMVDNHKPHARLAISRQPVAYDGIMFCGAQRERVVKIKRPRRATMRNSRSAVFHEPGRTRPKQLRLVYCPT